MNLDQRLTKLEERTSERQPVVIWVNPDETRQEVLEMKDSNHSRRILFVGWKSSEDSAL